MHVTLRRIVAAFIMALMLEGAAFAIYYDDLLYLRLPLAVITSQPAGTFERHAGDALQRRRLTAQHLESIAAGAQAFGLVDLELRALERRELQEPDDTALRLRRADALRRAGRLAAAERLYVEVLRQAGERP